MIRSIFFACLAFALGGCLTIPEGVFECSTSAECPDDFQCVSGRCYQDGESVEGWQCPDGSGEAVLCDGRAECDDGIDELKCTFRECADGTITIRTAQFCDGVGDCADGSDESDCALAPCRDTANEATDTKVPRAWLCDGDLDCPFYADPADPTRVVDEHQCLFCDDGDQKVHSFLYCDGASDCADGSDEVECFHCNVDPENLEPLPRWLLCDGNDDCPGGQDEDFCNGTFSCDISVPNNFVCDGFVDCAVGEDESAETCALPDPDPNGRAIPAPWPATLECNGVDGALPTWALCQGVTHCSDGQDELRANCPFICLDAARIPREWVCDGFSDCSEGEDESPVRGTDPCPFTPL